MIKGMINTGIFLFVVAAISGVLLAFTQNLTAPIIKENEIIAENNAQKEVLPSDSFSSNIKGEVNGKTIYYRVGFDKDGKVTGAVFKVSPRGFGGLINTMVGINAEGKIINYKILSLSETPGLGSKLTSEKFTNNMKALLTSDSPDVFKVKKDGGNVDAVTAATISSRAFCNGMNEALEYYRNLKENILATKYSVLSQNDNR